MEMLFRQPIFTENLVKLTYWGNINNQFIPPMTFIDDRSIDSDVFVGLKDIHKNEIFENDIVKATINNSNDKKDNGTIMIGKVFHDDTEWCIETNVYDFPVISFRILDIYAMEIIGNIWKNSDLKTKIENYEPIEI